jgi:hypothetical protein
MSMQIPDDAVQQRLAALEIDLSCALAVSNALLRAASATSPEMRHAVAVALDDALRSIATEDRRGSAAAHAILSRVRETLGAETSLEDRMVRDLERLIIEKASAVPGVVAAV